jgi:hypothetical protein
MRWRSSGVVVSRASDADFATRGRAAAERAQLVRFVRELLRGLPLAFFAAVDLPLPEDAVADAGARFLVVRVVDLRVVFAVLFSRVCFAGLAISLLL